MFIPITLNFCNSITHVILDGNCGAKLDWVLNMDCISKLYIPLGISSNYIMAGFPICTVICTLATGTWWRERDINVMEERLDGVQHWSIFIN